MPGFIDDIYAPEGQVDTISDLVVYLLARIVERSELIGDENVNCSSIGEVREAEASQQVAPYVFSMQIGQPFQISYGNGQSEVFVYIDKYASIKATLIPGTCS